MRLVLVSLIAVIALGGCDLIKHQTSTPSQPIANASAKETVITRVEVVKTPPILVPVIKKVATIPAECKFPKPLPPRPLPVAPTGAPGQTLSSDQKFALAQSYIWNLLDYIKVEHQTSIQEYKDYMQKCAPEDTSNTIPDKTE